jgi:hypothetical protein
MYQLSIDHGRSVTITEHPDRDDAQGALLRYVIGADYYLRPIQLTDMHSSYELLQLGELAEPDHPLYRGPRSAGHAVIEQRTDESAVPADSPYNAAAAARRWIDERSDIWDHGSESDPGTRYPLAVFTAARAESRGWFSAGTLIREAAHLAGGEPITSPGQALLDNLRQAAISAARSRPQPRPAEIASAVIQSTPADTPPAHTASLIWWYALLTWGVSAS